MSVQEVNRPISEIASEIKKEWDTKIYFGAKPYLDAMLCINEPNDTFGCEDGKTQVIYFLANASTYRGEIAKRHKAELKRICGIK
jgi:hypothetical protein